MSVPGFVAVTDPAWIATLSELRNLDEVNFWRPTDAPVRSIPGTPWFFKAKAPINAIVGGGFFVHYSAMPVSFAWEAFGIKNGVRDLDSFERTITRLRRATANASDARVPGSIGCVVLSQPYFLTADEYVPVPHDFAPQVVSGKGYDLTIGHGRALWDAVQLRLAARRPQPLNPASRVSLALGAPHLVTPRLGQGGFRVSVLDAYSRRCAVTGERTLPALEAAHIVPFATVQRHEVANGIALRSDIHRLFDSGYVTIDPHHRFRVSRAIRDEFDNGRDYYALHETSVRLPPDAANRPDRASLDWHASRVYRGD